MSIKKNIFLKNVLSMLVANGISFIISSLITFIIPKVLDVENYAYIQLYIFYTSYISYLHWGWVDGIRLRYGGIYYEKIDKPLFKSQIIFYTTIQLFFSMLVFIFILFSNVSGNRLITLISVGICMIIRLPRLMPQYILEMSNRIEECAKITLIEKLVYLILTLIVIFSGMSSVILLLICDLIGQTIAAIYAFKCCKDILKSKCVKFKITLKECLENIKAGIKLTIANVSSLLIIGIVRLFIEKKWDVSTFGKVSLTISISNLLMVFIRAVAMVMFPTLRRIDKNKLNNIYGKIRTGIMIPLLGLLLVYYPLKYFISLWLPQYNDSLVYMALLFPMCIFESKMSMLIETYLKTLRLENWLLKINILTVFLSLISTIFTTCIFHNLTLAVLSIVLLLAFRSIISENILSKNIGIKVNYDIIQELILVTVFICSSWFIGGIAGFSIYFVLYLMYLYSKRNEIKKIFNKILKKRKGEFI